MPGGGEILVILFLILMLFGPDKLPEFARTIGKGLRQVRKMSDEVKSSLRLDDDD